MSPAQPGLFSNLHSFWNDSKTKHIKTAHFLLTLDLSSAIQPTILFLQIHRVYRPSKRLRQYLSFELASLRLANLVHNPRPAALVRHLKEYQPNRGMVEPGWT